VNLLSKVSVLSGIGKKREMLFNAKGIFTVLDLLFYLPKRFKDYSKVCKLDADLPTEALYAVTITTKPSMSFGKKGMRTVRFGVSDETGKATVFYFNMPYIAGQIEKGQKVYLFGKKQTKDEKVFFANPSLHRNFESKLKFVPVYSQIHGISQRMIIKSVGVALEAISEMPDYLSDEFKQKFSLPNFYLAHKQNHFPQNLSDSARSKERFALEELLVFLCFLDAQAIEKQRRHDCFEIAHKKEQGFYNRLDFSLTHAQTSAIFDIKSDLTSEFIMNRLVQGDVGSGKTIVAFYAMYLCFINGYQSIMMAPTEVLAKQHFENAKVFFADIGIELITGSMTKKQRDQALDHIKTGKASMVFGTHALLYGEIEYKSLNLAITDEQHRFGVSQRAKISYNGKLNTLVMSATPIPRTLALVLYSNIDVSIIDELPKGRKRIKTHIVDDKKRKDMYAYIKAEVEKGHQAYVVCPLIESDDDDDKSVYNVFDMLTEKFKFKYCAVLHGKMKDAEKNAVMDDFKNKAIDVLVCTTVIEVGVDVANATLIVIEQADRFGLSTLHQLRGRVGRSDIQSFCFLVTDVKNDRLDAIKEQHDGFKLAQKDLEIRGPGQFLGKRQHGIDDFYMQGLIHDARLIDTAKTIFEGMKNGAFKREYAMAKKNATRKFEKLLDDIALN
jgi:ATP-dependent DNA helicase RecG